MKFPSLRPAITVLLALVYLLQAEAQADSEIKLQGRSTTSGAWSEIEDDDGLADNDSPRGGNGTQFGNVKLGKSGTRNFRIQNNGNETLNITGVEGDSVFSFVGLSLPLAIPANGDHEFSIRFTPTTFAVRFPRLVINNDEGLSGSSERRYTFRVEGQGKGPDLTIFGGDNQDDAITDGAGAPAANNSEGRHFGTVQAGNINIETAIFTLSNSGNDGLNLSNPRFTGSGAAHFGYNGVNAGANLGDGNARTFSILFNPPVTGTYDAIFQVDTNDERFGRGTYSFAVRGVAIGQPIIGLEGQSRFAFGDYDPIDNGDFNPRGGDGTNWGNRSTSAQVPINDHAFRITNKGSDNLTVTELISSNEIVFPINALSMPFTLVPDESRDFYISFNPATAKDYAATITIRSDSAIDDFFQFAVEGAGTGFTGAPPEIVVSGIGGSPPDYVPLSDGQFDTQASDGTRVPPTILGQTRTVNFRIRNLGAFNLETVASRCLSTNDSEFVLTGLSSNLTLGSGSIHDIQVQFTPASIGYRSSRIEIFSNDPEIGGVFNFVVAGFGTEEPAAEGPAALVLGGENFEEKVITGSRDPNDDNGTVLGYNGTHQSQFNIFNDGDEDLKVTRFEFEGGEGMFQIIGLDGDVLVPPGSIHQFTIDYTGPNGEEIESTVILETNDPLAEQYTFTIISAEIDEPAPDYLPFITAISSDANDILLTVDAPQGSTFQILVSLDLQQWVPIIGQSNLSAGTRRLPGEISGSPTGQRRFYKVEED